MRILTLACAIVLSIPGCGGSSPPANEPSAMGTQSSSSRDPSSGAGQSTPVFRPTPTTNGAAVGQVNLRTPASTPVGPSASDAPVADNSESHDPRSDADNTKINVRDRQDTLTPMNQGNSTNETQITATIRRNLMKNKSLSFTAKNVKIITIGTKVTLRGPVNSVQEKSTIEASAAQTVGVTDVDDQLEVKN